MHWHPFSEIFPNPHLGEPISTNLYKNLIHTTRNPNTIIKQIINYINYYKSSNNIDIIIKYIICLLETGNQLIGHQRQV